ncbi:hypothetical protein Sipo7851_43605 [Streptomyces ipomoeae]|nr:hypothetical protein Sipo7851_43605 [Streptomyces ipomoeae]
MAHCIALFYVALCTMLMRLLLPPLGRRRTARRSGGTPAHSLATTTCTETPALTHPHPLHGENSPLVRPYLLTLAEHQQQRRRYQALRLAEHGINADPDRIQGAAVAA